MWRISGGTGAGPWAEPDRRCTAEPEIDPAAVVRDSEFGDYTYLGPGCEVTDTALGAYGYAVGGNQIAHATIGKFANIATGVRINPSNHPHWRASLHHFTYRSRSYGFSLLDDEDFFDWRAQDRVEIGPDSWIGHNAIIMPGVKVGASVVVGSGAVVTRDLPDFAIAVGVPARVLRPRVDERTAERLLRIAWWDWGHAELDAAMADFRALPASEFAAKYDPGSLREPAVGSLTDAELRKCDLYGENAAVARRTSRYSWL